MKFYRSHIAFTDDILCGIMWRGVFCAHKPIFHAGSHIQHGYVWKNNAWMNTEKI